MENNKIDWNEIAHDMVHSKLKPIRALYIDITTIKDIRFMAFLMLDLSKDRYNKIQSNLTSYNERYDHEIIKYFNLDESYTEEDIDDFIKDSENIDVLSMAPQTSVIKEIVFSLDNIEAHNRVCEFAPDVVTIYINTQGFNLNEKCYDFYRSLFRHGNGRELHFINMNFNDIDMDTLERIDLFFLDDTPTYLEENTEFAKKYYKLGFQGRHVVSTKIITEPILESTPKVMLERTAALLSLFAEFKYIDKILV